MPEIILSDYFYGDESEEFVFFKIPRQLITNPKFKHVSTDAKLLYGMLLDRMSLSARNGWYDDTGRVYIYYSVDEICGDMTCGRDKAMKLLAELDTKKGVGLIERIKQGQGKPTRIYVKRFTTRTAPPKPAPPPPEPFAPISEVGFPDLQKSEIPTSRGRKNRLPEVEKTDPNYTKRIQTELIQPDPSISPRKPPAESLEMDRYERRKELKANIDYERLRREYPYDDMRGAANDRYHVQFRDSFGFADDPFPTLLAGGVAPFAFWYEDDPMDGCIRFPTELESERLMGLPDGWTKYGADGREINSAQRYRALGNSIALPCAGYIMAGISEALNQ